MEREPLEWLLEMNALCETARFYHGCDVIDISFTNGCTAEVYVVLTPEQRERAFTTISEIDLDGVLLWFSEPASTAVPALHMRADFSISFYDDQGALLLVSEVAAGTPEVRCEAPYSYVLQAPAGSIPEADLKLRS